MPDAVAPEFLTLQQAVVGRYSLERELGRGGMGIVFLARDVALDRLVAIKLLPPQLAAQPGPRERFLREAQMAAKLSHPNIIPIFSVEQAGDLVFFVMAYVEGESLGERVRARGPLTAAQATRLLQEVAWALAYAHLRGIVHRDIKPDNILLEAGSGRALVSDFGIARTGDTSGGTALGEVLGTAQYMSPEQACGERVDGRSDLYSLGVVGFFALSGRLPFDAPDIPSLLAQHITKPAPPLASAAPGVPRRLAAAVDRCLLKDPADRFQTGEALGEAVAQSTEVAREMPAPLRFWVTKGESLRRPLYAWTGLTAIVGVVELVKLIVQGDPFSAEFFTMLAVPWGVFTLYRLYQSQRVIAAGYGQDDMRLALRQAQERRQEELAFEYDRDPPFFARLIRWLAPAGLAAAAVAAVGAMTGAYDFEQFIELFTSGAVVAIGSAVVGQFLPGKRIKARDVAGHWRLRFHDSWLGRLLVRAAGTGVKPAALPAGATHRATEVAIGLAAEALFETLPKESRKALRDLPSVIKRLETDAVATRARVDELNAMLADAVQSGRAGASAALAGEAGAAGAVSHERDRLATELTAQRDRAAKRLAAAVAALENLRLDLLRLKAGVGTLDELSADLTAARDLEGDLERAIAAHDEVRAVLAAPRDE